MITLTLSVLSLLLGAQSAVASGDEHILGAWRFEGFYFDGHYYPRPNPALLLDFHFYADRESSLIWRRENEPGFCERRALYSTHDGVLEQRTIWVNPANAPDCARDPDMLLDGESSTPYVVTAEELRLFLTLNGQDFIYVLKRLP